MKATLLSGLLLITSWLASFAQEELVTLKVNSKLANLHKPLDRSNLFSKDPVIYILADTLSLPFIDDFSKYKLKKYSYPQEFTYLVNAAGKCLSVKPSFNNDNYYMEDTSWTYSYDIVNKKIDSTPKNPIEVVLFNNKNNCLAPSDTITVWPFYFNNYVFDTLTGIASDSTLVKHEITLNIVERTFVAVDSSALWMENDVYINRTYPIDPPTIGVATFDGLDAFGQPYSNFNLQYGGADTLTSKPIDLGGLTDNDKVMLSFYWQPQGIGNSPEPEDSLVLEFKKKDSTWVTIKSLSGLPTQGFSPEFISIVDSFFFYDGFQFRFRNYATLSGNNDHWHVDYVYLDKDRIIGDFDDIAIVSIPQSFLNTYMSMPFSHFVLDEVNLLQPQTELKMHNFYMATQNTSFSFRAIDLFTATLIDSTPDSTSFNFTGLSDSQKFWTKYAIPTTFDPDPFVIRKFYRIHDNSNADITTDNDTAHFDQVFSNYFAYDDGSAEIGYKLVGTQAQLAYKFNIKKQDTLRGVYIHWPYLNEDIGKNLFSLNVWKDINTDSLLYSKVLQKPQFIDSINGFFFYPIDEELIVNGTFYIGWQQLNKPLIVGFDQNTDASNNIFYQVGGQGWQKTNFKGSLMIRPVVGKKFVVGAPEDIVVAVKPHIKLFPNPASSVLYVEVSPDNGQSFEDLPYVITDILGRVTLQGYLRNQKINKISTQSIPEGIYILSVYRPDDGMLTRKFIIQK